MTEIATAGSGDPTHLQTADDDEGQMRSPPPELLCTPQSTRTAIADKT